MFTKMPDPARAFRRSSVLFRTALHHSGLLQIAVLALFWMLGEAVVRLAHVPLPGGIIGMAVVLALLASGWIRPIAVRRGASWLIAEMLLFFVPAVMAVLDHHEFVGLLGLKIVAVILVGTVLVMGGTALTVDLCYRWRARREARHAGA
ncbi:CidA/LrgA family protein [Xanthobacter agilis]|uniref:Holin-like protein n=1 Tax=Xanthobacter agilis TaxID=47492 RepID=A0ABU0LCJ1_XANAG|nr:CidA/LrgA family protein [Xanthobacter agilis]MDQ0504812.1 holin-like protein [Xanthobacter agilis]